MSNEEEIAEAPVAPTPKKPRDWYKDNPKFMAHTWRPGQSGNPGGRRKKPPSVYEEVENILERIPQGQQQQVRALLAEVLVAKALKGDIKSIREILSRSDPVTLRLAGADGGPIEFASKLVVGIDPDAMSKGVDPELASGGFEELPESSGEDVDDAEGDVA